MAKSTSCREAIQRWEEKTGELASEQKEIILSFQWPPIDRMDNSLAILANVEKLSLSTNTIEKITGIDSLRNLKVLSLGRNYIKTFSGLEAVGEHLEELWISYNMIEKIKGVNVLKALKVLYMSNNLVKDWAEFNRLQEIPNLRDLLFINNPICENMDTESWRAQVIRRLPALKKLDAIPIVYYIRYIIENLCIVEYAKRVEFFLQNSSTRCFLHFFVYHLFIYRNSKKTQMFPVVEFEFEYSRNQRLLTITLGVPSSNCPILFFTATLGIN